LSVLILTILAVSLSTLLVAARAQEPYTYNSATPIYSPLVGRSSAGNTTILLVKYSDGSVQPIVEAVMNETPYEIGKEYIVVTNTTLYWYAELYSLESQGNATLKLHVSVKGESGRYSGNVHLEVKNETSSLYVDVPSLQIIIYHNNNTMQLSARGEARASGEMKSLLKQAAAINPREIPGVDVTRWDLNLSEDGGKLEFNISLAASIDTAVSILHASNMEKDFLEEVNITSVRADLEVDSNHLHGEVEVVFKGNISKYLNQEDLVESGIENSDLATTYAAGPAVYRFSEALSSDDFRLVIPTVIGVSLNKTSQGEVLEILLPRVTYAVDPNHTLTIVKGKISEIAENTPFLKLEIKEEAAKDDKPPINMPEPVEKAYSGGYSQISGYLTLAILASLGLGVSAVLVYLARRL
jgi:hypothetical protein